MPALRAPPCWSSHRTRGADEIFFSVDVVDECFLLFESTWHLSAPFSAWRVDGGRCCWLFSVFERAAETNAFSESADGESKPGKHLRCFYANALETVNADKFRRAGGNLFSCRSTVLVMIFIFFIIIFQ